MGAILVKILSVMRTLNLPLFWPLTSTRPEDDDPPQSGRQDLNLRLSDPKPDALPG